MSDEYILDVETDEVSKGEVEELSADEKATFTEDEKEVLAKLEELTALCNEKGVSFFSSAKFDSQDSPSAAWYFGEDEGLAHKNFVADFAPLLLTIAAKMSLTTVKAFNPKNDEVVYSVGPDDNESGE